MNRYFWLGTAVIMIAVWGIVMVGGQHASVPVATAVEMNAASDSSAGASQNQTNVTKTKTETGQPSVARLHARWRRVMQADHPTAALQKLGLLGAPDASVLTVLERRAQQAIADPSTQNQAALKEVLILTASDPAVHEELIRRRDLHGPQEQLRAGISLLLSRNEVTPELAALAERLAASNDPLERSDGYELLRRVEQTSEVRALLDQALVTEQDPPTLRHAISAVGPSTQDPITDERTVSQLRNLVTHPDSEVRSASVTALGRWGRSDSLESVLYQALTDQAPDVRLAAAHSTARSGTRSDRLKATLVAVVRNPNEAARMRQGALMALQQFTLNTAEQETYERARVELDAR